MLIVSVNRIKNDIYPKNNLKKVFLVIVCVTTILLVTICLIINLNTDFCRQIYKIVVYLWD